MDGAQKPLIEPWLRRSLQGLVAVGFALVAVNFGLRWWFWEVRVRSLHLGVSAEDVLHGRLVLLWAVATLLAGFALCEILGSLPRVTRRTRWCIAIAAVLVAIPFAAGV